MTVRVVLADDQPLIRAGLRVLIADHPDLEIVGEAGTGAAAVELVEAVRPDVVVMDIRMPDMDGIDATRLITAGPTAAQVLMLTTFDDDDYVYASLRAGASGFVLKDMARQALDANGYGHIQVITRDGALGAAEHAPFDRIIVTVGA
ncbi:response regulator, partial [Actinomadura rubrisoli]